ncbi:MAG TPA: GNAT family N-acetyltransferase, partial [Chloroflexota bacterium]|nr:GNAT family N-acetyltransferase [Chloroflexota bacterium]
PLPQGAAGQAGQPFATDGPAPPPVRDGQAPGLDPAPAAGKAAPGAPGEGGAAGEARAAVTTRPATEQDLPAVTRIFGAAFDDYRRGFGVDAAVLARLWQGNLRARIGSTTVADVPGTGVVGFVLTVKPGAQEQFGTPGEAGRRVAAWWRALGAAGFWRLPALFIPMGLAYARRGQGKDELYISLIGVDPAYQGRGIGQALLGAAETEARTAGARAILLHTAATNTRARAAYSRAGYELVCAVRAPWPGPAGIPAYLAMRKPLGVDPTPGLDRFR